MNKLERKGDQAWYRNQALVVVGEDGDKRVLLELYHNSPTAEHLGQDKMLKALSWDYWWPGMCTFVHEYVKECARCQESKPITHPNVPPIQLIHPQSSARLFSTIAMDFIVKLPVSQGYDSVLTIMDYDCTKAVILLRCKEEIDSQSSCYHAKKRWICWTSQSSIWSKCSLLWGSYSGWSQTKIPILPWRFSKRFALCWRLNKTYQVLTTRRWMVRVKRWISTWRWLYRFSAISSLTTGVSCYLSCNISSMHKSWVLQGLSTNSGKHTAHFRGAQETAAGCLGASCTGDGSHTVALV